MKGMKADVLHVALLISTLFVQQTWPRSFEEMATEQLPELANLGRNIQIPSRPSLQQIRARHTDVTKLIDLLGIITQDNIDAQFPLADVPQILANLSLTTINQLKRSLPEYHLKHVLRHLNLRVADRIVDLKNISSDIAKSLKEIGVPSYESLRKLTLFDRDTLLQQLNVTTSQELESRLNVTNAKEIVSLLNLKSSAGIKALMPFGDVRSAVKYFGIPCVENIVEKLNTSNLQASLDRIGKQFLPTVMRRNVKTLRESILREVGVPSANDLHDRLEHHLSPEVIMTTLGIVPRNDIEKRLTQATGNNIAQRLSIPLNKTVEENLHLVSKFAILTNLRLPTIESIVDSFQNMDEDAMSKMIGLPTAADIDTLLSEYDPTEYVQKQLHLPDIVKFQQYVQKYENKVVAAIGFPTHEKLEHLLKDFNDTDNIIQQLDLYTSRLRNKFRQITHPHTSFSSLSIPNRSQITNALKRLVPAGIIDELDLPTGEELIDALNIFAVKRIIRDTKLPSIHDLQSRFTLPDYAQFVQELNLPPIDEIKERFNSPEVLSTLQDIGIPRLKHLKEGVINFGVDTTNEIIDQLRLPTRDEWVSKLPKVDASTLISKLNIHTAESLDSLVPNFDIERIVQELINPINTILANLRQVLHIHGSLERLGVPSSIDSIKSLITIMDRDKFFSEIGAILDANEQVFGNDSEELSLDDELKTNEELYKLLPFGRLEIVLRQIPTIKDIKNNLPIENLNNHLYKTTSLPADIHEQLIGMKLKLFDNIGMPDFYDLKRNIELAFDPDNLLQQIGLLSKEELLEMLTVYSEEELLDFFDIDFDEAISETLENLQSEVIVDILPNITKPAVVEKLHDMSFKIIQSLGLPTKQEMRNMVSDYHPETMLDFLTIPTLDHIKNSLPNFNVTEILQVLNIPSEQVNGMLLPLSINGSNATDIGRSNGWPNVNYLEDRIRNLTSHDRIMSEISLPNLDDLKRDLVDVEKALLIIDALPDMDGILTGLQLANVSHIVSQVNFAASDYNISSELAEIESVLENIAIEWPNSSQIMDVMESSNFSDALENAGIPRLDFDSYASDTVDILGSTLFAVDSESKLETYNTTTGSREKRSISRSKRGLKFRLGLRSRGKWPKTRTRSSNPRKGPYNRRQRPPKTRKGPYNRRERPSRKGRYNPRQRPSRKGRYNPRQRPSRKGRYNPRKGPGSKSRERSKLKSRKESARKETIADHAVDLVQDVVAIAENPTEMLPNIGETVGTFAGEMIGSALGASFGPIGSLVGGVIGGIVGGFLGRLAGWLLCLIVCPPRPPPDLEPPNVYCDESFTIIPPALQISADVSFRHATAKDEKYGDVSRTVRLEIMTSSFMPMWRNDMYTGSGVRASENYFRFHAWDYEKNHGWCDFSVTIRVLYCAEPPMIDHGSYIRGLLLLGSEMAYTCNFAFNMDGDGNRLCERIGRGVGDDVTALWSGFEPQCIASTCASTPSVEDSTVECTHASNDPYTPACARDGCLTFTRCQYTCRSGYEVPAGVRATIVCLSTGEWDGVPVCKDVQSPYMTSCPEDINVVVTDGTQGQSITWDTPSYHDNSGHVTVKQTEGLASGSYFTEGVHHLAYEAIDRAGNTDTLCSFSLTVHVPRCPPLTPGAYQSPTNCTNHQNINSACHFGCRPGFRLTGSHHAVCGIPPGDYVPSWMYHNSLRPVCTAEECRDLFQPENTQTSCSGWFLGSFCTASCTRGLVFEPPPPMLYACTFGSQWVPHDVIPQCAPTTPPIGVVYHVHVTETTTCMGNDYRVRRLHTSIERSILSSCARCTLDGLDITCDKARMTSRHKNNTGGVIDVTIRDITAGNPAKPAFNRQYGAMLDTVLKNVVSQAELLVIDHVMTTDDVMRYLMPSLLCPPGYVGSTAYSTCVGCKKGAFYDQVKESCTPCVRGTYQDNYGQSQCTPCPPLQSTPAEGSESPRECTDMCTPGHTSPTGLTPCVPCRVGTYQSGVGQDTCVTCPTGQTTQHGGTADVNGCVGVDLTFRPGQLNDAGLSFTHLPIDPPNDFSVAFWLRTRTKSLTNVLTVEANDRVQLEIAVDGHIVTVAVFDRDAYVLSAPMPDIRRDWLHVAITFEVRSYTNGQLSVYIDGQHRGSRDVGLSTASPDYVTYSLFNGNSFTDIHSLHIWTSALDAATITRLSGHCDHDLEGDHVTWTTIIRLPQARPFLRYTSHCDDTDNCASSPCIHGRCTDLLNSFKCACNHGYTGKQCEADIDVCVDHNCQNGGACLDGVGGYTCACVGSFTGSLCEVAIVDGGWGEWMSWGGCTKTCGGGRNTRKRQCDQPVPQNGGHWCVGHYAESGSCNNQTCPFCSPVDPPKNGLFVCDEEGASAPGEMSCTAACLPGYNFTEVVPARYRCGPSTAWMWTGQGSGREKTYVLPSCSLIEIPERLTTRLSVSFPDLPCESDDDVTNIDAALNHTIGEKTRDLGGCMNGRCKQARKTNCGQGQGRRRETGPVTVDLTVSRDIVIPEVDFTGDMEDVMAAINSTVTDYAESLREVEAVTSQLYHSVRSDNFTVTINGKEYRADAGNVSVVGEIACPKGTARKQAMCVACSAGTFHQDNHCVPCRVSTYQPEERQTECRPCPHHTITLERGSRDLKQCGVFCDAGTYKTNNRCVPCPVATYQPLLHQTACRHCPVGHTTLKPGSLYLSDCVVECQPGTYRQQSSCTPCPVGTFQSVPGQPSCNQCPDGLTTDGRGAILALQCRARAILHANQFPTLAVTIACVTSLLVAIGIGVTVWRIRKRYTYVVKVAGDAQPQTFYNQSYK